jgi:hypothetical protein
LFGLATIRRDLIDGGAIVRAEDDIAVLIPGPRNNARSIGENLSIAA